MVRRYKIASKIFIAILVACSIAIANFLSPQKADAAVLTVTNEAELRLAVITSAPGDTIDISSAPNATITLNEPLTLHQNVTLQGGTLLVRGDFRHINIIAPLSLNLENLTIKGRKTSPTDTTNRGGGIHIAQYPNIPLGGTVSIVGIGTSTISDCYAAGGGGGISGGHTDATLNIDNLNIINNTSSGPGGGVSTDGTVYFISGTISGNASLSGGGIFAADGVYITGGTISNNTTEGNGGGIFSSHIIDISGGLIDNNRAVNGGGGVYMYAAGLPVSFNMSGGIISNNYTMAKAFGASGPGGGGVLLQSAAFNMSGGVIEHNISEGGGGGVAQTGYSNSHMIISGNAKIQHNQTNSTVGGGGIFINDNIQEFVIKDNASISNNTSASYGGGIAYGGTYSSSPTNIDFNIDSGTIADNTATYGGGIYFNTSLNPANSLNIGAAATISNNTASMNGGGIYMNKATLNLAGTISGNTAIGDTTSILNGGGGIFLSTGTSATVESTAVLTGNSVTNGRGGAIYTQTFPQVTTQSGATFSGNTAIAVPWLITDNDMSMQDTIATYNTQIKSTTHSTLTGSDNIYNGYDINFAANIANEPIISEPILVTDQTISGTSDMPAGTTITVYFRDGNGNPDDNPKTATTVSTDGTWQITIPDGVALVVGHTIEATADTPDLLESTADDAIVTQKEDEEETPPANPPQIGVPDTGYAPAKCNP